MFSKCRCSPKQDNDRKARTLATSSRACLNEAGNLLITADSELESYYGERTVDSVNEKSQAEHLREAEVNALVAIGYALTGILIELQARSEVSA